MITNEYTTTRNGNGVSAHVPESRRTWRDECLERSLQGNYYGECIEALTAAVRHHQPQTYTMLLDLDRVQLLEFMRVQMPDLHPLCTPTESLDRDIADTFQPYTGWWGGTYQDKTIEVAFSPSWYANSTLLALGDDMPTLKAFGQAATEYATRPRSRSLLYSGSWQSAPQIDAEIGKTTWDDLVFPAELLSQIREAVEGWASSKALYEAMGFSWRRGILLVGPPGTGKTMIGKAAAAALPDFPFLYVRDLRERNREALAEIFKRARKVAPCILVIEDVDTLITPANRTILLNEIDGFKSNEGILTIASTNHPHKIDEAFLKRPSRFDRVLHIGLPADAERAEFCRRVLARAAFAARLSPDLDTEAMIQRVVEKSKGFTPAYLKEALTGAALSLAHRGFADLLDQCYADAVIEQVDELKKTMQRLKNPAALAEMTTGEPTIGLRRSGNDD